LGFAYTDIPEEFAERLKELSLEVAEACAAAARRMCEEFKAYGVGDVRLALFMVYLTWLEKTTKAILETDARTVRGLRGRKRGPDRLPLWW